MNKFVRERKENENKYMHCKNNIGKSDTPKSTPEY